MLYKIFSCISVADTMTLIIRRLHDAQKHYSFRVLAKCCTKEILCSHRLLQSRENIAKSEEISKSARRDSWELCI